MRGIVHPALAGAAAIQLRWIANKTGGVSPAPSDHAAAIFISLIASEFITAPPTRLVA